MITVGSIWVGRGIKIRILLAGIGVIWIERLDLPASWPATARIHPWRHDAQHSSMRGMKRTT